MISICYSSLTGNTKLLAETIKENIKGELNYFGETAFDASKEERIFVGFWTDKGSCDLKTLEFLKGLKNKEVFLFGTCGFGCDPSYFEKVLDRVKSNIDASNKVIGTFMCQGKMPLSVKERYLKIKKTNPEVKNIDLLISNFDSALTHPDSSDLENLKEVISKL